MSIDSNKLRKWRRLHDALGESLWEVHDVDEENETGEVHYMADPGDGLCSPVRFNRLPVAQFVVEAREEMVPALLAAVEDQQKNTLEAITKVFEKHAHRFIDEQYRCIVMNALLRELMPDARDDMQHAGEDDVD